ncbi:MAG: SynChlorMet cassette protein ScmC [Deltaproteobacteria bacterium]|nr:SynChlorMet cassette protein ScmC [Deltaproteobacteria bacterium]
MIAGASTGPVVATLAEAVGQPLQRGAAANGTRRIFLCGPHDPSPVADEEMVVRLPHGGADVYIQMLFAAAGLISHLEPQGVWLLHAALAEWQGQGILLAGPGGTGKSTASRRLPAPWRSWSDDAALVVPDAEQGFRVHPWPTFSDFFDGGPGGRWDVAQSLPLGAIFCLYQSGVDRAEAMLRAPAAAEIAAAIAQQSNIRDRGLNADQLRLRRLRRLDQALAIAAKIPVFHLDLSLSGAFWEVMAEALSRRS